MLNKNADSLRLKTLAIAICMTSAASAYADKNDNEHGYGHSPAVTHFSANPAGTAGQGQIQYTASATGSSIQAGISLPVTYPAATGIPTTLADSNAAIGAAVSLVFPNGGGAGVTCNLLVEDVYLKYPKSPSVAPITESADYELSVKSTISGATNTITAGSGSCVTTGTAIPAIPVVAAGDPVDVILNGNLTPILIGAFK